MEEINQKIYDKAVKFLSVRLHTTGELHQKLKTRGFKDRDILLVLRRLEELKFLDDQRFAEIFTDNLKRYKDWGYFGIKAKLLGRHIPSDIVESALAEFYTQEDELIVAQKFLKKQKRLKKKLTYEKLAQGMQARGFRSEVVGKILSHLS